MADATVLKTVGGNPVRVRVPSPAPASESPKTPLSLVEIGAFCMVREQRREQRGQWTDAVRCGSYDLSTMIYTFDRCGATVSASRAIMCLPVEKVAGRVAQYARLPCPEHSIGKNQPCPFSPF